MAKAEPFDVDGETPGLTLITLTPEQFAALTRSQPGDDTYLQKMAELQAKATKQAMEIDNRTHPDVSAFNPRGERDYPRPDLKCAMFFPPGYKLERQALTLDEITLLNQIEQVGPFPFQRPDGSLDVVTVTGERDANGRWVKITLAIAVDGDKRLNLPSLPTLLRAILGLGTVEDELRRELAQLKGRVA